MRKSLGSKNRELDETAHDRILALYDAFDDADPEFSKVFTANDFGYWTITVERPLLTGTGKVSTDRKGQPQTRRQSATPRTSPSPTLATPTATSARTHHQSTSTPRSCPTFPTPGSDDKRTKNRLRNPFTRHFYKYTPPRPSHEIDADLDKRVAKIMGLLREVEGS